MITIDYHPFVNAIIESWRASLAQDNAGRPIRITDDDLKDLIRRLCRAIEVLSDSMDSGRVLLKLHGGNSLPPKAASSGHVESATRQHVGCVVS